MRSGNAVASYGSPSLSSLTWRDLVGAGRVAPDLTPTFINTATDSLIGTAVISYAFPTTPPQTTYRASYSGCCWLSTLRDGNNDASYNVWTTIPIDMSATQVNHAPVISSVPMVGLFLNTPWSFRFPAVDADGDLVSYRLTCANAAPIGSKNMA